MTLTELFTNIANAIRAKTGSTESIIAEDFPSAIEAIPVGSMVTTTISEEQADWAGTLTIPELIGAKYFIIQGNPLSASQTNKLTKMDDTGVFYQLIYLNGTKIAITCDSLGGTNTYASLGIHYNTFANTPVFDFETTTGTVSSTIAFFQKFTVDTSTTDVVYTVYRLG